MSDTATCNSEAVPEALKALRRWLCWRYKKRNGKTTKVPYVAGSERRASSTDPDTWTDFDTAQAASEAYSGVGVALGDGFAGMDLDNAIDADGELKPWAADIVRRLDSYTEVSPSGRGVKIFLWGRLSRKGNRRDLGDGHVEVYWTDRYFTVTGRHLAGTPHEIRDRQEELEALHRELFPPKEEPQTTPPQEPINLPEGDLLERMFAASNGSAVRRLWEGDIDGYPSQSEADCALCAHLAFWTGGDRAWIDRLFRRSGLCRDKWTERSDYRARTISKALEGLSDTYEPRGSRGHGAVDLSGMAGNTDDAPVPEDGETVKEDVNELLEQVTARLENEDEFEALTAVLNSAELLAQLKLADATQWEVTRARLKKLLSGSLRLGELDRQVARAAEEISGLANDPEGKELFYAAARHLAETGRYLALETDGTPELYHYEGGVWRPGGKDAVNRELETLLKAEHTEHAARQVHHHLRAMTFLRRSEMGLRPGKLAVANGLLNIENGGFRELRPEDHALARLPVRYDPEADCPQVDRFLAEVLAERQKRATVWEYMGYALQPRNHYKRALIIFGPTDAGKSVLLDFALAFYGPENDARQTIQDLANRTWALAQLYGRPINIRADLGNAVIDNIGLVKELIAGDSISAEKKFKDPFTFRPRTKFLFSANEAPRRSTEDDAFWSRWITLIFPRSVPKAHQDKHLIEKLTTPGELSGALNRALEGLERLEAQGGFSYAPSAAENQRLWDTYGSALQRFISACVEPCWDQEAAEPQSDIYRAYCQFAEQQNATIESKGRFTRELKKLGPVAAAKRRIDGSQVWCYTGMRLRDEEVGTREKKSVQRDGA